MYIGCSNKFFQGAMLIISYGKSANCSEIKRKRQTNFSTNGKGFYQFVKPQWSIIIYFLLRDFLLKCLGGKYQFQNMCCFFLPNWRNDH